MKGAEKMSKMTPEEALKILDFACQKVIDATTSLHHENAAEIDSAVHLHRDLLESAYRLVLLAKTEGLEELLSDGLKALGKNRVIS